MPRRIIAEPVLGNHSPYPEPAAHEAHLLGGAGLRNGGAHVCHLPREDTVVNQGAYTTLMPNRPFTSPAHEVSRAGVLEKAVNVTGSEQVAACKMRGLRLPCKRRTSRR